jgi:tetratricopeptide (TPR) repeat protein
MTISLPTRSLPLLASALCAGLLAFAGTALSQDIPGYPEHVTAYDPREVALLPKYCIHTQLFRDNVPGGNDQAEIRRWYAVMGETFHHMHHYCWGLMKLHRAKALARDARVRSFNYASAIDEFDYVLKQAKPNFVLLPEILVRRGEALLGLGRHAQALAEFERAIELKPDYWPAYAQISDHYKSVGELAKARQALEDGLQHAPDAKGLRRRLQELEERPAAAAPARRTAPTMDK